jgi:hypothetical protein
MNQMARRKKMNIKNFILFGLVIFLSSGCALFKMRDEVSLEDKASVINSFAKTSTYLALKEIFPNRIDRVPATREMLLAIDYAMGVLESDEILTGEQIDKLLKSTYRYRLALYSSLELFNMYFITPKPSDVLNNEQLILLKALFSGIQEGGRMALLPDTRERI